VSLMTTLKAISLWVLIVLAGALTLLTLVTGHSSLFPLVFIGFALWLRESLAHDRTKAAAARNAEIVAVLEAAIDQKVSDIDLTRR